MAEKNIPIYHITYETMIRSHCNAIIAVDTQSTVGGLLEKALIQDMTVKEDAREEVAKTLKILGVKRTEYDTNKEGVIYFG